MKKLLLLAAFSIGLLSGCTSLNSQNNLSRNIDKTYHSYQLKNNSSNEALDPEIAAIFETELNKQLANYGYKLGDDITIHYDIKAYDPGNRALRMFIGFGAGKGTLEVETTLIDKHKNNLGSINNEIALKMGWFGGSLTKVIRRAAIDTAKRIYKSRILTK
ncbi:DUF4410 domain-containing protein [Pasteurella oralis]|uniref:DUF4410 domain-containing protein n=1 Tax=Pasteurella oralis TaxID=1071947 RepID=A0ABW4NQI2_9PAST|nr:DUF4410 domain-containing protein [Pasteurella oralis]MDO5054176.1 DUF4410 domain-containing protein [Pasteurella oralis]